MRIVIYSLWAMVFYAAGNVVLEVKLAKYNSLTLMAVYGAIISVSALVMRQVTKTDEPVYHFPVGKDLWILIALGLIFTLADYFFISAYTNGGKVLTITSITLMFPVLASLMKMGHQQVMPNRYQVIGYLLAVAAVLFVTKGSPAHPS